MSVQAVAPAAERSFAVGAPSQSAPPLWLAFCLAALSGPINALAFPDPGWWPLIFVGTALMLASLVGRTAGTAFAVGLVGGAAYWFPLIDWLTVYLGPVPWLALAGLQALFFGGAAVLIALAWRYVTPLWPGTFGRLVGVPAVLAGLWTLYEAITSTWPYGGFSWGRLAFSLSESPFGELVAWVGASGLSFLVAWTAAIGVQAIRLRDVAGGLRAIVAGIAIALLLAVPEFPNHQSGQWRVAAVQGNSDAGLFSQYQHGQILQDHVTATVPLFGEDVDVVVWPENSSDLSPLEFPQAAQAVDYVSREMDAPLVTGTITHDEQGRIFNSMLLWEAGQGAVDQYDKIHPVPFAEYLPDRDFWYPLAPSLFDLVPRDYSFGQRDNVFDIEGVIAGIAICFDIVDDSLVWQMLDDNADIILAPTNNADFGRTDESAQQLGIARLRAIEAGRSVVNISTVGTSAIIAPDGSTIAQLPVFEPGSMVETVPLSDTVTPASVLRRAPEWAVGGFALTTLLAALMLGRRRG